MLRFRPAAHFLLVVLMALFGTIIASALAQTDETPRYFETDLLNPGLPDAGDLFRDTPQATLESFKELASEEQWQRAANLLDLSSVPLGAQIERGPELAQMLHEVVSRSTWIDWSSVPDRPDGLDAFSSREDPMAGVARRSIRLALVDLGQRTVSIRLSRIKPATGPPVWLFASQTVENIPEMYAIFGPTEFERALPQWLRAPAFWTLAIWEVIALPLVALLALVAAYLANKWLAVWAGNAPKDTLRGLLNAVRVPAALGIFVAIFAFVRDQLFTFSGR